MSGNVTHIRTHQRADTYRQKTHTNPERIHGYVGDAIPIPGLMAIPKMLETGNGKPGIAYISKCYNYSRNWEQLIYIPGTENGNPGLKTFVNNTTMEQKRTNSLHHRKNVDPFY